MSILNRKSGWFLLALAATGSLAARANDSSAELSTGGLVFMRSDAIVLQSEELFISPKQVRVRYRFINGTNAPVRTLVAFPMPDVTIGGPDDVVAIPKESASDNFLGFSTFANGQPVVTRVEQKVFVKGVERTQELTELGVPLAPYLERMGERLDRMPEDARKKLVALGLAVGVEESDGRTAKMTTHLHPTWTLKTTYYWEQDFLPGETTIEHSYAPSVGVTLGTSVASEYIPGKLANPKPEDKDEIDEFKDHVAKYCIDDDFIRSARRIKSKLPQERTLMEQRISYILKTAANWSGPIRDFRLVVDKQYPDNLVSFCGSGVRKTGPTTFEMEKTGYTPTMDLSVLILTTHVED